MSGFKKAERRQAKLKIALTGPSGAGKTMSALLIAHGIGKRIAVIDTENGSASLYAGQKKGPAAGVEFDALEIHPPYTIAKYIEALKAAEREQYDVLIIDSISHAWAGEGGLLAKKEAMDSRGGNSFANWGAISKEQEAFKSALLYANMHLICTMRSKQDYILETNDRGKQTPKKVGLAPIQREGMEYEFTTVFDLGMDHNAIASKDRTGLFDNQIFKPSKLTGGVFVDWLKGASPELERPKMEETPPVEPPKTLTSAPAKPGVRCTFQGCEGEMLLHPSGQGYYCEKAPRKEQGHTRFSADELPKYLVNAVNQSASN